MTRTLQRYCFAVLLLACGLTATAYAQPEPQPLPRPRTPPRNIKFDHLPERLGLTSTRAIWQGRNGFMWFGDMFGGLTRYDGYTGRRFAHDPDDSHSLSSNQVRVLYEDEAGMLWIGTADGGLNHFDPATETFTCFRHAADDSNSVSADNIRALLEDREGRLWVGTGSTDLLSGDPQSGHGLNLFDRATETFTHFRADEEDPGSISDDWVGALLEDRSGRLWVGSWGLDLFNSQTQTFDHFLPDPALPEPVSDSPSGSANWVTSIYEDGAGRLWVGALDGGLYLFDPETGRFTTYRDPRGLRGGVYNDVVSTILEDPEGGLWLGTETRGLVWFDPEAGTLTAYRHDPQDPYSLSGDIVMALYKDRQGVMWAGIFNQSVNHFDRAARPFEHIYARPGDPNSLRLDTYGPLTIYEGPDDALWVTVGAEADSTRVLNRIDRETGRVQHFRHDPADPNSLGSGLLWAVLVDPSGAVWTGGDVLSRMDPDRPGHFTHFRHDPADTTSLGPGTIRSLYRDTGGTLWVGHTNTGLSRLDDPERGRFTRFPIDARYGGLNSIYEDSAGILWLGTGNGGLYRFDPEAGTYTNYLPRHPQILGVCESPLEPGVLWAAVYLRGLTRFDKQTGTFTYLTRQNSGLPDNGVQGVLCDDQGQVWVSTDAGLARFDPGTGAFETFDLDDGLQGLAFNSWAYHKSPYTGAMFFGGKGGVNAFFPSEVRANPNPPEVTLTGMRLFDEPVPIGEDSPLARPLSETEAITLRHRENDLTFDYVGLHFANPTENQYAYKLEPYDADWREVGSERRATFTNLDPGTYTFRVKAANSDGVWNEEGASLRITILPPWWQTWWAYTLYGLLFLGGVFATDRVQRRRLIRKERERAHHQLEAAHTQLQQAHTHLKTTQQQLVHAEKMASLGALTAGIAHEIKNPLNFVNNFAQLSTELTDEIADEIARHKQHLPQGAARDLDEMLADLKINTEKIEEHGRRADGIVRAMMDHARGGEGERREANVNGLVEEYLNLAYHGKRANTPDFNVTLERSYDDSVGEVEMVPQEMGRVLINLLNNAFDAVHERMVSQNGQVAPTVRVSTRRVEDEVEIEIRDNGPGISAAIQEKIFEPFFTTKPTGSGTGLGLSLSYDIVTQGHGGTMAVESAQGEGATFVITLPA